MLKGSMISMKELLERDLVVIHDLSYEKDAECGVSRGLIQSSFLEIHLLFFKAETLRNTSHVPQYVVYTRHVIKTGSTPNGFTSPPRGWNSYAVQTEVITQCDELPVLDSGHEYCTLNSGWSVGDHGDEHGRIIFDPSKFYLPALADHLHIRTIKGTSIKINDTMSGNNNRFARCDFDFAKDRTQGVDLVKLDYITPGSPDNGANLPADSSGSVIAFLKAIQNSGREVRLDISWKPVRSSEYSATWAGNADSMRTDQDINESGSSTFVKWATVQRAIDNYRDFISGVVKGDSNTLTIYPDWDNLLIGNAASVSSVSDAQRQTIATHWFGAAANLTVGSDLTNLDDLGRTLLTDSDALGIPRNPETGGSDAKQLQAWVDGPAASGFGTSRSGTQNVTASYEDLGLIGTYNVKDIWQKQDLGSASGGLSVVLDEGESYLFNLTPV
ncbi:glycoside hydrolase [Mytilinidion resinicola]|uniref:alpha-galactosidase n=1 Tax=Mytilinidion resinicola TaxID=574789 RepID=A0A6A6Z6R6_9PEZI|nr:glycoside hydrolase [Mytilinidion resinicola]KAF2816786.1 glycoside hydrolase [Mytilinidion resinicola]